MLVYCGLQCKTVYLKSNITTATTVMTTGPTQKSESFWVLSNTLLHMVTQPSRLLSTVVLYQYG